MLTPIKFQVYLSEGQLDRVLAKSPLMNSLMYVISVYKHEPFLITGDSSYLQVIENIPDYQNEA